MEANHGRFKLKTVAALTDSSVLALAPLVVLIAFVTADAKAIAKFEPFLLLFRLVLIVEFISNVDLNSVVARLDCFDVPFNVIVLLNLPDVVDEAEDKQRNKGGHTCYHQV